MVDQLSAFASEVTRVAKEVGTEGKLGGQAEVGGVAGTWEDLTDNVNAMASNLTNQVRNIADVTTAVARGDLSKKITVDARGEILELKNTVNTMVDQLQLVRVGSDARREGSRHRRQAGRPGRRARRRRHVEGPHRQRQRARRQPDGAAARRVEGRDRDRQRRLEPEDHGAGAGRNSADQERHQHDDRPAERVRVGSDARGARSRHRRQARRPGRRARRRRHVARPHRLGQLDGRQPDRPGPQHRRRHDRGREGRPVEEDHRRGARRNSRAEEHHQHDGGPAERVRVGSDARGARSRHRRGSWAARPTCPASAARGRTSPTTSTRWPAT